MTFSYVEVSRSLLPDTVQCQSVTQLHLWPQHFIVSVRNKVLEMLHMLKVVKLNEE
uniref:Uncharacterized protein n=1 Tax=Amphimedon queenslandica TaxID=400682 RepID=A0A1X7U2Y1_AMPQE